MIYVRSLRAFTVIFCIDLPRAVIYELRHRPTRNTRHR